MASALVQRVFQQAYQSAPINSRLQGKAALRGRQHSRQVVAYDSLTPFCQFVDAGQAEFYGALHLRLIAEALERVERGECKRLMIFLPPGHWKSSLTTGKFPAWAIGRDPTRQILSICNDDELALDSSRSNRDLIQHSEEYAHVFPGVRLADGQKSLKQWGVQGAYRYTFRAIGMQGGVTGRRGGIILIDDPVKNQQQVGTKAQRDKLHTTYQRDIYSRLAPDGAIVLIMTRWHEDDLAGRLLAEMQAGGEQWDIICLPAVAEPGAGVPGLAATPGVSVPEADALGRREGEALWPAKYDLAALRQKQQAIGARGWAALYQQRPRVQEGGLLQSGLVRRIALADVPPLTKRFRMWDLAFSDTDKSDFCSGAWGGIDKQGRFYVLHIKRRRGLWPESKPLIIQAAQDDGVQTTCAIEANGTQRGYYDDIKADPRMRGRRVVMYHPKASKEARAALWGSRLVDGIVFVAEGEWNAELFDEMDSFPNAPHDDMVDSVSGLWELCATQPFGGMYSA